MEGPLRDLLKANGTPLKTKTARLFLRTIEEAAQWFLDKGLLNIPQWDHLGEDLRKREKVEPLPVGTSAIWTMIRGCLTNPRPMFTDTLEKEEDIYLKLVLYS